MRVLFIHQNFPAQFIHVARALAAQGHTVKAMTDAANTKAEIVPTLRYAFDGRPSVQQTPRLARAFAENTARGEAVAAALGPLARDGFAPDVIVGHPGWGETLFVQDVFPQAKLILHAEHYYAADGGDANFDPEFQTLDLAQRQQLRTRNAATLLALTGADIAVAPTAWQAGRFPPELRRKINVIHEGIDTATVAPHPRANLVFAREKLTLRAGDEVITFVSRNLEPYRGYHIFMRALPAILAARPKAHAVIVGGSGVSYGRAAKRGRTWKATFFEEVREKLPMERVHFVGKVPYDHFVKLMQITAAHVYLTYPFVLSWSMLEAMSAGALVIGSRTAPVEEIITHGRDGLLVDFFDHKSLSDTAIEALARPKAFVPLRVAARERIIAYCDLRTLCLPQWLELIRRAAESR